MKFGLFFVLALQKFFFFLDSIADKTQTKKIVQYILVSYLHLLKLNLSQNIFIKYQLGAKDHFLGV